MNHFQENINAETNRAKLFICLLLCYHLIRNILVNRTSNSFCPSGWGCPSSSLNPSGLKSLSIPFYPLGLGYSTVFFYPLGIGSPSGGLRRSVNHALHSHSLLGRKVLVRLPNTNDELHLVSHHLRILHSCTHIWKELAHHIKRSFYIFVSSKYRKRNPKILEH